MSLAEVHTESSYMTEDPKRLIRPNPHGDWPQIDSTAYVDLTAQLIGNVHIGPEVFIGPNVVIRADETDAKGKVQPVKIEAQCNVQDGVIIHALGGTCVIIGQRTSLSHGCTIHGPCTVGKGCFVGFRTVLYDVILGDEVFVGTGAIIQGVELGQNSYIPPAQSVLHQEHVFLSVSMTSSTERQFMERVTTANLNLARGYNRLNEMRTFEKVP